MRPFILGQITRIVVVPAAFRRSDTALSERIARWTVGRPDMALFIFTRAILANEPIQIFTRGRMARDFHVHRRYRRRLVRLVDRLPIPNANCAASKQTRHVVSELKWARTNAQAIPKGNGGRRHGTESLGKSGNGVVQSPVYRQRRQPPRIDAMAQYQRLTGRLVANGKGAKRTCKSLRCARLLG